MNILIVENTPAQSLAARSQLEALGHSITVVESFDAFVALSILKSGTLRFWEPKLDFDVVLTDCFMPASPAGLGDDAARPYFLSRKYETTGVVAVPRPGAPEVPYGMVIAMIAAMAGAKRVGVLSLGCHHGDPMAWAMDSLEHTPLFTPQEDGRWGTERFPETDEEAAKAGEGAKRFTRTFNVNGAIMAFFTGYACPKVYGEDGKKVKNWAAALERLMGL